MTFSPMRLSFRYFTLKPPSFYSHYLHWPRPIIRTKAPVLSPGGGVSTYQRDFWNGDSNQPSVAVKHNKRESRKRRASRKGAGLSFYLVFGGCGRMNEPVQQSLWPFNFLAAGHIRVPSRTLNPRSPLTPTHR